MLLSHILTNSFTLVMLPVLSPFNLRPVEPFPVENHVSCLPGTAANLIPRLELSARINGDMPAQQHMRFTENRGQIVDSYGRPRPDVLYTAKAGEARLYFTRTGMCSVFLRAENKEPLISEATGASIRPDDCDEPLPDVRMQKVSMVLTGCNQFAEVTHAYELTGYDNFYVPHCPEGITHVRSYRQIRYRGIYDGIDFVYHTSNPADFKYEFVVAPHADPALIRMNYDGADALYLDSEGNLHVVTSLGEQVHLAPYTYVKSGRRVNSEFIIEGNTVGFRIGDYDLNETLVIDPWAIYYGGSSDDGASAVETDANGDILIAGNTFSTNFPITNSSTFAGLRDTYVMKCASNSQLLWATYFGGNGTDGANGISVHGNGDVVTAGTTESTNLPVTNSSGHSGAKDAFLLLLNGNGIIQWATYYGGGNNDEAMGCDLDINQNIVITGSTNSTNLPVTNTSSNAGGTDLFLLKCSPTGTVLHAGYFGGNDSDIPGDVAVDGGNNILVAGRTMSTNFPVTNSSTKASTAGWDAFVMKLDSGGTIYWATYYGGTSADEGTGISSSGSGDIVVTGSTWSSDFPTTMGPTTGFGQWDAFVMKFSSSGSLLWSTYYGTTGYDRGKKNSVDANGNIAITGFNSLPTNAGVAVVAKFNSSGTVQWTSYYGVSVEHGGQDIAFDVNGNVIMVGAGAGDAFVVHYDPNGYFPVEISQISARYVQSSLIRLIWTTLSETNNRGFEVQRSFTAKEGDWETRGFVPGAGTSAITLEYTYIDEAPPGLYPDKAVFYRLRQIDFDGSIAISHVVEAFPSRDQESIPLASISPQPAERNATLLFALRQHEEISVHLYDPLGRKIERLLDAKPFASGTHAVSVGWKYLSPGVYYICIEGIRNRTVIPCLISR